DISDDFTSQFTSSFSIMPPQEKCTILLHVALNHMDNRLKTNNSNAGDGIRTHEHLRDWTLNPAPLTKLARKSYALLAADRFRPNSFAASSLWQHDFVLIILDTLTRILSPQSHRFGARISSITIPHSKRG
ncbi:MAG: hypothetical protein MUO26_00860, partial [Methanotrichaceae archaeon]|nr:hypothetical protein [Methanotrichaceae archaeon]